MKCLSNNPCVEKWPKQSRFRQSAFLCSFISFNPECPAQNVAHIRVNNIPSSLQYDHPEFIVSGKASTNTNQNYQSEKKVILMVQSDWERSLLLDLELIPCSWCSGDSLHHVQGAQLTSEGEDGPTLHIGLYSTVCPVFWRASLTHHPFAPLLHF